MAFLKKKTTKKEAEKKEPRKEERKEQKKEETYAGTYMVRKPWISEKATKISADNQYIFLTDKSANKVEIKKEVEGRYGGRVENVNTVRYEGKMKHWGRKPGRKPAYKKAIVTLKEGEKIEIM